MTRMYDAPRIAYKFELTPGYPVRLNTCVVVGENDYEYLLKSGSRRGSTFKSNIDGKYFWSKQEALDNAITQKENHIAYAKELQAKHQAVLDELLKIEAELNGQDH